MKIKKIIKSTSLVLASLLLLLGLWLWFGLGFTAKTLVERIGPKMLGTSIAIEHLSINPRTGTINLRGFQMGIPDKFNQPYTGELSNFHMEINMRSLFSKTIIIHKIQIDGPHLIYEQNQETDNFSAFIRNIEAFTGKDIDTPKTPKNNSGSPPKNIIVEQLEINDLQMHLANTDDPKLDIWFGIEQVSLSLTNGVVQLNHLFMSNPKRIPSPHFIKIESIHIQLDPESLFSKQIVIQALFVESPNIHLEQTETTSNLAELQLMAKGFSSTDSSESRVAGDSDKTAKPLSLAEQPILLQSLITSNLTVNMTLPPKTQGLIDKVSLKKINPLKRIGGGKDEAPLEPLLTIARLETKPLDGLVLIDHLRIGNPAGFSNPTLLALDRLRISIDPAAMQSDIVQVKVRIDTPRIAYEQKLSTNNIKVLQASIEAVLGQDEETKDNPQAEEAAGVPRVIIHLLVEDGTVSPKLSALPALPVPLPNIEKNIGEEDGGISLSHAFSAIYGLLYDAVVGSVSGLAGFTGDTLKGAASLTANVLGTVTGGASDKLGKRLGLGDDSDEKDSDAEKPLAKNPDNPL